MKLEITIPTKLSEIKLSQGSLQYKHSFSNSSGSYSLESIIIYISLTMYETPIPA